MGPPSLWQHIRQTVGRALRETGQALDRLGVKTKSLAITKHDFYDDPVIYEDFLSRHRHLMPLLFSGKPLIHPNVAYLAPCSTLIGSVRVGKGSSIWYGAVLRADSCENTESFHYQSSASSSTLHEGDSFQQEQWNLETNRFQDRLDRHGGGIYIGENTNIQDNCIITSRIGHCTIGNGVTVGHLAQIHSATIEDFCLIGMGSIINEGCYIEKESFVAAGAVIAPGQRIKSHELWVGNPARKVRDLTDANLKQLHYQSSEYVQVALEQRHVMELGGNLSESMFTTGTRIEAESGSTETEVEGNSLIK